MVQVPDVRRPTLVERFVRWTAAVVLALVGGLGLSQVGAGPAFAAGDEISSYDITYDVQASGVVKVQETIDYRFGSSGRHGIERFLVTREKYDDSFDAVYGVSNLTVSSPDRVSTEFSTATTEADDGRENQLRIRVGDPDRTLNVSSATYVISYDLTGALRTFSGYDEFYWDATGLDWDASIASTSISASVPGGAQGVTCTYGAVGSTSTCATAEVSGERAEFAQRDLGAGEGVTIGVKIGSGLVSDNAPHLEPDGSQLSTAEKTRIGAVAAAAIAALVGSPIVGVLWWRKHGRDDRYAGLAPGTFPLPGQPSQVIKNDPDIPIPVSFAPPKIPVAEAGLLIDGQVDPRETAATIIDLAVRGALTVQSEGANDFRVTLVDPSRAAAPHEMVLLTNLFGGAPPGAVKDLSERGSMLSAHTALQSSVRNQVTARGWFRKVPSGTATGSVGFGAIALVIFGIYSLGAWVLWVAVPLLPIIITVAVVRNKLKRGQRTADGRAVCDQIEGFRTYLATAEADQLRFEEGEDIFSRYLPWAIMFELADRWAKVCGDLVKMGRVPDTTPYWYYGSYNMSSFNMGFLTGSLTNAATPAPSTSGSSGTGFGGGSSFSGGGFSGGGGGGGGGGSW